MDPSQKEELQEKARQAAVEGCQRAITFGQELLAKGADKQMVFDEVSRLISQLDRWGDGVSLGVSKEYLPKLKKVFGIK